MSVNLSAKPLAAIVGLILVMLIGAVPALAQSVYPGGAYAPATGGFNLPPHVHGRPYIVITPRPPLYRRCVDWLELQHRPSGTVLYPQYRCWWVRG